MDIEILKQNQENLDAFKQAISNFASPHVLDVQMENLKVVDKNLYTSKQHKKETRAWLKENKQNELYHEYNSFFKRYEKCFNKIQDFQKKFSHNTISLRLNDCKDLLTENFEAKANLSAQTYAIAQSNFNADIHSKTILVETKYQKGGISADSAFEHMSKLGNSLATNPLSNGNADLKDLIGSYQNDYSAKTLFKNDEEIYLPETFLTSTTADICKGEIETNHDLQDLMQEATKIILELNKKLDLTKINNMLIDAQEFLSSFGSANWDESKASKFMDKFENQAQDLEKLALEFESYENKLAELIFEIQQKKEQTQKANEEIAKIEARNRLNKLIENIAEVKKLLKNNTPFVFLKKHFVILNKEYKEIETTLGVDVEDSLMQRLGSTRHELEDMAVAIKKAEFESIVEHNNSKEKVLEFKPDNEIGNGVPKK